MTTSILSPLSRNLNGHDLQTLRDFALSAPYEWRQALRALVDVAEQKNDEDEAPDYKEQLEDLRIEVRRAVDVLTLSLRTFSKKLQGREHERARRGDR